MTLQTRWWPMWLFVAICLLLNALLLPLVDWIDFRSWDNRILAFSCFAGVLVGECCFLVLVSGLMKRTWLGGFLFGTALAAAGYAAVLGGLWIVDGFHQEAVAGVALLPVVLLVAAAPLYGLRRHFGWRLVSQVEVVTPPQPLRLADIFSQIAIVASVLGLARVPQVITESDANEYWLQVVIACAVLLGASILLLPLHARIALGSLSVVGKCVWLTLLPILIAAICFGITQCFAPRDTSWEERLAILPFMLTFLGAAVGVFYLSLLMLHASGLRLVRGRKSMPGERSEVREEQAARLQRLTWWRIGGAVAVTMASSIYLANLQQWRAVRDKENALLRSRAQATGGELGVFDRIPANLSLGPQATDDDLAALAICTQLENLYLHDNAISDRGLEVFQHFTSLTSLTLHNLKITDAGLVSLKHLANLEMLVIQNCDVTGSSLRGIPDKQKLRSLDFSQTQFGDDQCESLVEFPKLNDVTLSQTQITDRGLAALAKLPALTGLDVSATDVIGSQFPFFASLYILDLSETAANDVTAASLVRCKNIRDLNLGDTNVTNAALSSIARLPNLYRLDISNNSIDDVGIAKLKGLAQLNRIDLSGTQVTGSGFADWRPRPRSFNLILDRAPIDDPGVAHLIPQGTIDELSLAETAITDACLPHLAQIAIGELDISGTRITFNGLIKNGLPGINLLRVAPAQFTPQQISQLEKQLSIKVSE